MTFTTLWASIPVVPWWLASLVANFFIFKIEALNRMSTSSFTMQFFGTTWWMVLIAQWGLYVAWRTAPSMMLAWAWFTSMNLVLRLISTHFVVGEPMAMTAWIGTSMIFGGMLVMKWGAA